MKQDVNGSVTGLTGEAKKELPEDCLDQESRRIVHHRVVSRHIGAHRAALIVIGTVGSGQIHDRRYPAWTFACADGNHYLRRQEHF